MLHKLIMFNVEICVKGIVKQTILFPTRDLNIRVLRQNYSKEIFRTICRYLQQDLGSDHYLLSIYKLPCVARVLITCDNPRGLCCNMACDYAQMWSKTLCKIHAVKFTPQYVAVKHLIGNDIASIVMTYLV